MEGAFAELIALLELKPPPPPPRELRARPRPLRPPGVKYLSPSAGFKNSFMLRDCKSKNH